MQFYLAREKDKRNGLILKFSVLILKFSVREARFRFMLCNPLHVLELPRKLSWWINIIPGRVWESIPDYTNYSGHIISFFYRIYIPLRKDRERKE